MPASKQRPLQLDHIIPRHLAPERLMDRTNVRTLCGWCNRLKGGSLMTLEEIRAVRLGFADPAPLRSERIRGSASLRRPAVRTIFAKARVR